MDANGTNLNFGIECGDHYIQRYRQGALLLILVNMTFLSSCEKHKLQRKIGPLYPDMRRLIKKKLLTRTEWFILEIKRLALEYHETLKVDKKPMKSFNWRKFHEATHEYVTSARNLSNWKMRREKIMTISVESKE